MLIVTDVTFKRRWVNIREQFKKSLNGRKSKIGEAADWNVMRYKYEEVLQFLMPHINGRSTISSTEQHSENDSDVVNSQVMACADGKTREKSVQVTGMLISNNQNPRRRGRSYCLRLLQVP